MYTYDCFLDIACYCLKINHGFVAFQNKCLKEKKYKETFIIRDCTQRRLILILTMMTVLCMFGVTVTVTVMIATVKGNKLF